MIETKEKDRKCHDSSILVMILDHASAELSEKMEMRYKVICIFY